MEQRLNQLEKDLSDCRVYVHERLDSGELRMGTIESKIDMLLDLHDDFKGFFRVMGWIGKATVWTAKVGAFIGAAWLIIKDHLK